VIIFEKIKPDKMNQTITISKKLIEVASLIIYYSYNYEMDKRQFKETHSG